MYGKGNVFHDLITSGLGSMEFYQGYLDNVMALKYEEPQLDGFEFASEMLSDYNYDQIQKELSLNIMATYVDVDSDGRPFSTEGFKISSGSIPVMKSRMEYGENQMRRIMVAQQRLGGDQNQVVAAAKKALFDTHDKLISSHEHSLTYQRHQMVSRGEVTLTDANNPNGIKNVKFSANIPAGNNVSYHEAWYHDAERTSPNEGANPIQDLKNVVKLARKKMLRSYHFEVSLNTFSDILAHPVVMKAIGLNLNPLSAIDDTVALSYAMNLDDTAKQGVLERLVGAKFKIIDSVVATEKWDTAKRKIVKSEIEAFDNNVFVLVPDGKIGEILVVEPIKLPLTTGGTYGDFYGGRLLLTVDFNIPKKIQHFKSEMAALVVPNQPQYMFYLKIV